MHNSGYSGEPWLALEVISNVISMFFYGINFLGGLYNVCLRQITFKGIECVKTCEDVAKDINFLFLSNDIAISHRLKATERRFLHEGNGYCP